VKKTFSTEGGPLAAIKWASKNQSLDTAIVCMTDHEQLDENLRAMAEPYTNKDDQLLHQMQAYITHVLPHVRALRRHLRKGVPVPDMLRYLTTWRATGNSAWLGEVPGAAGASPRRTMQRLQAPLGRLSPRRAGARPGDARSGKCWPERVRPGQILELEAK